MGAYQTIIVAIVVVVVILANLLVTKMDINIDLSSDQKFSLTEESKTMLGQLKDDITIYYMVEQDKTVSYIDKVLQQYDAASSKIKVVYKDPVLYPKFSKKYVDDDLSDNENDVIVLNETTQKAKFVPYADMVVQDYQYSQTSSTGYDTINSLDVEGQVTAGILNVTSTDTIKMYLTSGHNETEFGTEMKGLLAKANMESETKRLASLTAIPDDCDILMINGPTSDLTTEEAAVVKAYLDEGKKAIFMLNIQAAEDMPNYYGLIQYYGVNVEDGYLVESADNAASSQTVAVAQKESQDITKDIEDNKSPIIPYAKPLTIVDSQLRNSLKTEAVLSSSEDSFARLDAQDSSTTMTDKDKKGPFSLAVAATDTFKQKESKVVIFSSQLVFDDSLIQNDSYANRSLFLNSVNWMSDTETETLAIPTRSLDAAKVEVSDNSRIFYAITLIIIVPLAFLVFGFAIWFQRRKR